MVRMKKWTPRDICSKNGTCYNSVITNCALYQSALYQCSSVNFRAKKPLTKLIDLSEDTIKIENDFKGP